MSRTMKDSGIEWIGDVPEGWEVKELKYSLDGLCDGTHGTFERVENGELLLSAKNIGDRGIVLGDNESQISHEDYTRIISNGFPSKGDVLLCCVGSIGKCCIFNEEKPIAFQRSVAFLRHNKTMTSEYLMYLLKSNIMQAQYEMCARKSAQSGIYMGVINNFVIVAPHSITEQQAIADYLDKKCSEIDSLIDLQEQMIEELKAYKQSVITEAVTKGIRNEELGVRNYKDSGIEWIGDVPEEWEVCKLKYFTLKIGSGSTPTGGSEVYVNDGVKFLRSQNVYFEGLLLDDVVYISDEIDENMKGTRVLEGDVLLNITGGSIGRCFYVDSTLGRANVNQHVSIIRPYNSNTKYIKYYLQSYLGQYQVKQLQTGGNREGLSAAAIKDFRFINCPLAEQQAIADYLDRKCGEIDELITIKQQKIESLKEYKKSVIYEYVTGKKEP